MFPRTRNLAFPLALICLAAALRAANPDNAQPPPEGVEVRRFPAIEAKQGVAVDHAFVYVISNHAIGKYDKKTGRKVAQWEGSESGPIIHLNAGIVLDGKLYCAHSNYPAIPMTSSLEIWDTATLEHIGTHSFGIMGGSLTWIDWYEGTWWAAFGMYTGKKAEPGKDPSWTTIVQFDEKWRRLQGWVFPRELVEKFAPSTNSGGCWGPDGLLYCTGHDYFEAYVVRLPKAGSTLEYVRAVAVASFGQGIVWDRYGEPLLWGIDQKNKRMVVASRVPFE